MPKQLKILAYTASAHRPLLLRHCIYQIQTQSYSLDHGIYINSKHYQEFTDTTNYCSLIDSIPIKKNNTVLVHYGQTLTHHLNHMAAIRLFNWQDYDLFLKIDDDDIYKPNYVSDLVDDYLTNKWDFSGEISSGHINQEHWYANRSLSSFKINRDVQPITQAIADQLNLNISILTELPDYAQFMPGTFVWNKKCMTIINSIENILGSEDSIWRQLLCSIPDITVTKRKQSNYSYHRHSDNSSRLLS